MNTKSPPRKHVNRLFVEHAPAAAMSLDSDLLNAGLQHHRAGQFQQAEEIYGRLLAANPGSALVLNLLGAVCINLSRWPQAAAYLADAVRIDPNLAAAHDNTGVLSMTQNRFAEAVESFRRAVALDPRNAATQMNLANALLRGGQLAEAINALRRVLQMTPDNLRAHAELARLLIDQGRRADAVPHLRHLARLQPADARTHFELADALAQTGQIAESIDAYHSTIRLMPDSAEACINLSYLYFQQRASGEAERWSRQAIELRPRSAEAYHNLGCALSQQEKYLEAIEALQTAAALKPEMSDTYNNLGIALAEQGRFDEATAQYRHALALRSNNAEVLYNLGSVYIKMGDFESALAHLDRAIQLRPEYGEARHNRSAVWLLHGKYAEGLAEYEWRFRSRDFPPYHLLWKLWNGEPLSGRTIVLCGEQGLGDTLQFVRYAPLVKAQGARVVVQCEASLRAILARTPGIDALTTPGTAAMEADYCVPMMSLPHRLGTTVETIPAPIPYVFPDKGLAETWRQKLAPLEAFKVGIVWQGNPRCPGDRSRSIALEHYAPLARVDGVRLVNLQKGPGSEQLACVRDSWQVVELGDDVDTSAGAFMDTAAVMQNLDLVITSDTAAAHLAGALGVKVWVALQMVPDWRFMLAREDSPWYPAMRLFRQTRLGGWPEVFEQIADELEQVVAERPLR